MNDDFELAQKNMKLNMNINLNNQVVSDDEMANQSPGEDCDFGDMKAKFHL